MDRKSFIIGGILGMIAGAGIGAFAMHKYQNNQIVEVCSEMREYYRKKYSNGEEPPGESCEKTELNKDDRNHISYDTEDDDDAPIIDYTKVQGRPIPFGVETEIVEDEDGNLHEVAYGFPLSEEVTTPYSISPDQFSEDNDYKKILLTWYEKNRVLAYDSNPHITIDQEYWGELVGDFEAHFGDWERDSVYIRNEIDKVDYAIDACITNYDELIKVVRDTRGDDSIDD